MHLDDGLPNFNDVVTDTDSMSLHCLCDSDGEIVGVASAGRFNELDSLAWTYSAQNPCELTRVGIKAELHRQGVGYYFMSRLIADIKRRGFDSIRLLVSQGNMAALALYTKAGFFCCGETHMYDTDFYFMDLRFNLSIGPPLSNTENIKRTGDI